MSRFKYPVDTDQFQRIREDGKVYVDKNVKTLRHQFRCFIRVAILP
ncbi:MAG: hypothetical protein ACI3YQ_11820 [Prevotella sp.]